MAALKITRRTVDDITFSEHWGGEFIPKIEDCVLDDTLAASMSYGPPPGPRSRQVMPTPPPPPPSPAPALRSPGSSRSPGGGRPAGAKFMSPRSQKKKSLSLSLSQISENQPITEGSMSELSGNQSIQDITQAIEDKVKARMAGVRFADDVEMNEISRLRDSVIAEVFYESEDFANFRYEAFMEEAGLDPNQFD